MAPPTFHSCVTLLVQLNQTARLLVGLQISDPRVADLVRSGKVRVALYLPQYTKDPATGESRGRPIEPVRNLGERMGA